MSESLKILSGRHIPTWGNPVFIAAVHLPEPHGGKGIYYTENAFFVPGIPAFKHRRFSVEYPTELQNTVLKLDKIMAGEIEAARAFLENFLMETNKELYLSAFWFGPNYEFAEVEPDPLIMFRLKGMFERDMMNLAKNTTCPQLRDHIQSVHQYPALTIKPE